ncbi:MAG: hypothetical protein QOG87_3523 [Actinomycetota bacterium]|jgi:uncharacterized membrane protein
MNRLIRVLLLGAVAFGIVLAVTAAPSSGGTRGQSGYGDDTVPPCREDQSGQEASAECLAFLETQVAEPASATDDSGNTVEYLIYGVGVLVVFGGVTYFYSKSHFKISFPWS